MKLKVVKMILGQNCYHIHRPVEYKNCTNGEPWAVKTKLGWTLCGPLPQQKAVQMTASCVTASEVDALAEQIKTWWDIESYASRCDVSGRSKEAKKALQMLEQITKFDGERFEVGLLWKGNDPVLPNNYSSALSQTKSLEYRLEKKPELKKLYQDSIKVDNEETLKRRDEIVAEMDELLKHSGDTSIYSELHRMEGIMARARLNWQEQQLKSRDTSPQKNANEEETQGSVGPNSFVNRCVNEVNSLPGERYQCASKTRSRGNITSVSSKSTTTKQVMLLELEAMKKQDEIDEQLAAKKRQAEIRKKHKEMDKLTEELGIAKLQKVKARAKRIAEKEMEIARAEGSRASTSLRSISPIPIHSDPFEKVRSWLDENGCDEKTAKFGEEVSRLALASESIKPQPDPLPHTTQMSHLAAKTAQPTMVKDGTSASQFAPNAASAKMQMNKTFQQHVQFGNFEPPNQQMLSNQTRSGTLPPPVAPSAKYSAPYRVTSRQQEMKQ